MSECVGYADSYKNTLVQVTNTKKAIVVTIFFIYCMFVVSLAGKHIVKAINDDVAHYWFNNTSREMVTYSFF